MVHKDPICGMAVDPAHAVVEHSFGTPVYFCSDVCRRDFLRRAVAGGTWKREQGPRDRRIAYFSMEIQVDPRMPTYAGGLGILAGDMLRSCADLRVPTVGVTLLHRRGYFVQRLDPEAGQQEEPATWDPATFLTLLPGYVHVVVERRPVRVQVWTRELVGAEGHTVPILLLDTDVEGNTPEDRRLTDFLYGGDRRYRLSQEIILGIGGYRALLRHGYGNVQLLHLNEGHAALAAVELLRRERRRGRSGFGAVQRRCVFTTHTPVPAGHDQFEWDLVEKVLWTPVPREVLSMLGGQERLNLTLLALNLSHFVNGVARRHEQTSELLFPGRDIRHITNGVHSATWTSLPFRELFDRYVPEWRDDPAMLRKAGSIPSRDVWAAHQRAKRTLLDEVRKLTGLELSSDLMTVGYARRATGYKRPALIFTDLENLRQLGKGRLQLLFAGKAHPHDQTGKDAIRAVQPAASALGPDVPVAFLPNYDASLSALMVAGVDLWLNTPKPPLEASGTSGMKAAHNGVPSLSTLDGWWLEGCVEGITGWSIGGPPGAGAESTDEEDARALLEKLEQTLNVYFEHRDEFIRIMQQSISLNASYFNSHRMVQQYAANAYMY